jgi:hypothetical protein
VTGLLSLAARKALANAISCYCRHSILTGGPEVEIDTTIQRCRDWQDACPDGSAARIAWKRAMRAEGQPAHEGVVEILAQVSGEGRDAMYSSIVLP